MIKKIVLLMSVISLLSCRTAQFNGNFEGGMKQGTNQLEVGMPISDNIFIKSSISQPYIYSDPRFRIPDYTETSIKIDF